MKKIFALIFFILTGCGDVSKVKNVEAEKPLRLFTPEELIQFESEIDAISRFEKSEQIQSQSLTSYDETTKELARALSSDNCLVQKSDGYIQKDKWLEKNISIAARAEKNCALFGSYRIKKSPLNDSWQNSLGFSILNPKLAKKNGVSSFYLKWSGDKNRKTNIHGEGFWFSNRYGKAQIHINAKDDRLQIQVAYKDFQVQLKAEKIIQNGQTQILATRGQDRISYTEFQKYLSRLGSIAENIQL